MVPELTRSSIAGMVDGIADCAARRGYLLRLFVNRPAQNNESIKEREKELWSNIMSSSVDGVLYINDEITDEHLEIMKDQNTSLVLTNTVCNDKEFASVSIDYHKAAYDITKEMISRGKGVFSSFKFKSISLCSPNCVSKNKPTIQSPK